MKELSCIHGEIPTYDEWKKLGSLETVSMAPYLQLVAAAADSAVACVRNGDFLFYGKIKKVEDSTLREGEIHLRGDSESNRGSLVAKGRLSYSAYNQADGYIVLTVESDIYHFFLKSSRLLGKTKKAE